MTRFAVSALVIASLICARAGAQPSSFTVVDAKVVKGKLQWEATVPVTVPKEIAVEVEVNGQKVVTKQTVAVTELRTEMQAADLKNVKATDAAGKAIDAEKLAELLKQSTPVVFVSGPVSEKHRKLFKDNTVFVQQPAPTLIPAPVPPKVSPPAPPVLGLPPVKP